MRLCTLEDGVLLATFDYDAEAIAAIKELPKEYRSYDPEKRCWTMRVQKYGKVSDLALKAVEDFLKKWDFKIQIGARNYLSSMSDKLEGQSQEEAIALKESTAGDSSIEVSGLGGELRPFQRAGVSYMSTRKRVLLGDEMGLGKTVQAIATIVHTKAYPCLIICPVSLQLNWIREAKKWALNKTVTDDPEQSADFVVVPYSRVVKHEDLLKKATKWQSMVCDESHYLKNGKAQRTKAIRSIAKKINDIYLLSGTPITNRPAEFITQLQILRRLDELGGWGHFTARYCDAKQERFGLNIAGASNLIELNERLRRTCYIRRFKSDVLKELPQKQRSVVEIQITNRRDYETARKGVRKKLVELRTESRLFTENVLADTMHKDMSDIKQTWAEIFPNYAIPEHTDKARLKREFNARLTRREMQIENSEGILLLNSLKQKTMAGKLKAAKEWIEDFIESGEKLVVFCDHIKAQHTVYEAFEKQAVAIFSSMDTEERQASVDRFQKDDSCRLIVCSLGAGGVGFTMTAASNVLFVEMGWTPAIHDQAEDRTHRIGQKNAVTAYYMIGKDTIDQDIYDLIQQKRKIVSAAADGAKVEASATMRDILEGLVNLDTD